MIGLDAEFRAMQFEFGAELNTGVGVDALDQADVLMTEPNQMFRGFAGGFPRLPLLPLEEADKASIQRALSEKGLI